MTMVNKFQFFYALFEHCTDKIYKPVTEQRLKVYNSRRKTIHLSRSIGISFGSAKSKKSMTEFVELAHTLEKKDGNKSHGVTIKSMESWHQSGKNVFVRNQVNFFHKIETGHFMSCGKVSKVPGDFILDELTNQCLHPNSIGTNHPISSRMIVQLGEQSYEIPSAVYLNVRPQSVLANCKIPGSNKMHLMLSIAITLMLVIR